MAPPPVQMELSIIFRCNAYKRICCRWTVINLITGCAWKHMELGYLLLGEMAAHFYWFGWDTYPIHSFILLWEGFLLVCRRLIDNSNGEKPICCWETTFGSLRFLLCFLVWIAGMGKGWGARYETIGAIGTRVSHTFNVSSYHHVSYITFSSISYHISIDDLYHKYRVQTNT